MFYQVFVSALLVSATATDFGWTHVTQQRNVDVYTRAIPGFSVDEVCATMDVNVSQQALWRVLEDVGHFPEFIPYVTEARILKSTHLPSGMVCQTEYHRVAPPLIKSRDYTLVIESEALDDKTLVRRWRTANHAGPVERRDAVRVHIASGSWTVKRLNNGQSRLTYKLLTEPGGSVPSWLANRANRAGLPNLLEAVHTRAAQESIEPGTEGA